MSRDTRRAWAQTLVGRVLADRYRLEALVDVGGMGAVFEGRHLEVDRDVAIKTVVPGALDTAGTERLRREARQAAAVGGAGVVDVMDFGVDEVCGPYLVMELLVGETLATRLAREGKLEPDAACELVLELLATLARVHAHGLVHRDLKPENLFLARDDRGEVLKILDFGIARQTTETGDTLTAPGAIVGTPRFMAPEQAEPGARVDARADVYAVGAILYTSLSGREPYDELDGIDAVAATRAGPPRPIGELAPQTPDALRRFVMRAMAASPEERFEDAADTRSAMLEALGREAEVVPAPAAQEARAPVDAPTLSLDPRAPAPRPRWPFLALAAALLVGVGVALAYVPSSRPPEEQVAPNPPEPAAEATPEPASQPAPEPAPLPELAAPTPMPTPVEPAREPRARRARPSAPEEPASSAQTDASEAPGRTGALTMEDF